MVGEFRGFRAFRSLAGVVLCVTGAEALYADMGHFGAGGGLKDVVEIYTLLIVKLIVTGNIL